MRLLIATLVVIIASDSSRAAGRQWTNVDVSPQLTHAERAGWSKDGAEFGYCVQTEFETRCVAVTPEGQTRKLSDCVQGSDETCVGGPQTKRVQAHGRERGYAVRQAAGARLAPLWWQVTSDGAFLLRTENNIELLRVALPKDAFAAHPDAITLSPDRRSLGIVIHYAIPTSRDEQFKLELVKASALAAAR